MPRFFKPDDLNIPDVQQRVHWDPEWAHRAGNPACYDYGRMRETWLATHDNELAVATGVEHTARPISAAAAIMVVVFGSFATANVLELKQFGLGLALAIAIDATLIRLILVPALMRLFGARNWWLPQRLSRPAAAAAPEA